MSSCLALGWLPLEDLSMYSRLWPSWPCLGWPCWPSWPWLDLSWPWTPGPWPLHWWPWPSWPWPGLAVETSMFLDFLCSIMWGTICHMSNCPIIVSLFVDHTVCHPGSECDRDKYVWTQESSNVSMEVLFLRKRSGLVLSCTAPCFACASRHSQEVHIKTIILQEKLRKKRKKLSVP